MTNLLNGDSVLSMADTIANLIKLAPEGKGLLVYTGRYSYVGKPEIVCAEYIYYPPGGYEIGSTGSLGGRPAEWEKNPSPKLIPLTAISFVEYISWPAGDLEVITGGRNLTSEVLREIT